MIQEGAFEYTGYETSENWTKIWTDAEGSEGNVENFAGEPYRV